MVLYYSLEIEDPGGSKTSAASAKAKKLASQSTTHFSVSLSDGIPCHISDPIGDYCYLEPSISESKIIYTYIGHPEYSQVWPLLHPQIKSTICIHIDPNRYPPDSLLIHKKHSVRLRNQDSL